MVLCRGRLVLLGLALAALTCGFAAEENPQPARPPAELNFNVTKTFDGHEFACEMKLAGQEPGYQLYRFKFPSPVQSALPSNNTVYGKYYWPAGMSPNGEKRPAVVCLHILSRDFTLVEILCAALAGRGIPAAMIELPYYGERLPPEMPNPILADATIFPAALAQAVQDTRRTIDMLQARPEVNAERIGLAGISLGGILTGTVAGLDERVYRAALVLAGGNLPRIVAFAREASGLRESMQKLPEESRLRCDEALRACDPLAAAGKLRARAEAGRVLMYNAAEDEVIPRACTEELAAALGLKEQVRWLEGMTHYTALAALPKVLGGVCDFYAVDLPPSAAKAVAQPPKNLPQDSVVLLLRDLSRAILFPDNETATCCIVDLEATGTHFKHKATLRYLRSGGGRFRLEGDLPVLGKVALGQGEFPWLLSKNGVLFKGSKDVKPGRSPLAFADASALNKAQAFGGVLSAFALFPSAMDVLVGFESETTADGNLAVRANGKSKNVKGAAALLTLAKDGVTPCALHLESRGTVADVTVKEWRMNGPAAAGLFDPPQSASIIVVEQEDLQRVFSAFFNHLLEEAD
ncbi:MAG: prolyl oligopeptidase family serine peptidase [Planctomycetota bacterium]